MQILQGKQWRRTPKYGEKILLLLIVSIHALQFVGALAQYPFPPAGICRDTARHRCGNMILLMAQMQAYPGFPFAAFTDSLMLEVTTAADDSRPVYIAGNFNDWRVNDEEYRMERVQKGRYQYVFRNHRTLPRPMEYKYIRGGWQDQELDSSGRPIPNRHIKIPEGIIRDFVPSWQTDPSYQASKLPIIRVIHEAFEIPQLIRTRRISALLPWDYEQSGKRYPVLYLQDGQNLFEDHAPFGTWGVDKKLAALAETGDHEVIIIAIDHAEKDRIREYTPSIQTKLGKGDGRKYVRFLAETLKPYIDRHFRTLPDRMNTGIGGSSMGGLITMYAGLRYPEVFSKLMVFSPSLWVSPGIRFKFMNFIEPHGMDIYVYGGEKEGSDMVQHIDNLRETLEMRGLGHKARINIHVEIDPEGRHQEASWGREFPKAMRWLYSNGPRKQQLYKKHL